MTIEVPIDVVVGELRELFTTPKSVALMRGEMPGYDSRHRVVEFDGSTRMVYEDGAVRATVDLAPVGSLTAVTIRVPYGLFDRKAAELSVMAQLCAFESLEQGYRAGLRNGMRDERSRV
jgi:hypothetical protein